MIETILFDLYKTLLDVSLDEDSSAFWSRFAGFLRSKGVEADEIRLRQRFYALRDRAREREADGFVMDQILGELLSAPAAGESQPVALRDMGAAFRTLSTQSLTLRPYTVPLLNAVKASHCRTGLVSNTEAVLTNADLDQTGLRKWFDVIILSSEVGTKKPDQQIFAMALDATSTKANQAVFVGDNFEEDILGAHRAGLRSLYLNSGGEHFAKEILGSGPEIVGAFPELTSILRGLEKLGWSGKASDVLSPLG